MTREQVLGDLQKVFDSVFLEEVKVTPELTADQVTEWDSLLNVTLVLQIESHFGLRFATGEFESFKNVGQMADLISRRLNDRKK